MDHAACQKGEVDSPCLIQIGLGGGVGRLSFRVQNSGFSVSTLPTQAMFPAEKCFWGCFNPSQLLCTRRFILFSNRPHGMPSLPRHLGEEEATAQRGEELASDLPARESSSRLGLLGGRLCSPWDAYQTVKRDLQQPRPAVPCWVPAVLGPVTCQATLESGVGGSQHLPFLQNACLIVPGPFILKVPVL